MSRDDKHVAFTMKDEKGTSHIWIAPTEHRGSPSPVGHIIRPYQLRPEWLLQRAYNDARGTRRVSRIGNERPLFQVFGYPLRHTFGFIRTGGALGTAAFRVATSRLFADFEDQFRASLRLRYYQGDFAERYHLEKIRRAAARAGRFSKSKKFLSN